MGFGTTLSTNQKNEIPINPIPPQAEVWELITQPGGSDQQWQSVAFGNGLFVACSAGGSSGNVGQVITSPDGRNWTAQTLPVITALTPRSVTYGNGMFVISCSAGFISRILYSSDGITWLPAIIATLQQRFCVCFGNGKFVCMASSGNAGERAATSPDGINWTIRNTPTPAGDLTWEAVTYANGLFVAVASNGTDRVMTSPDGVTWTMRDAGLADAIAWREICYGNGLYVAVGTPDAQNNAVMTSPDGITWTLRPVSVVAGVGSSWFGVVYANGTYVAVGDGATNSVMKSTNGILWESVTTDPQTNQSFLAVTYGNGVFVAVANSGTIRIMISGAAYNNSDVYEKWEQELAGNVALLRAFGSAIIEEGACGAIESIASSTALTDGQQYIEAIYLRQPRSVKGLIFRLPLPGVFTADLENSVAVYNYDPASGAMVRLAISANDGNIWKQASAGFVTALFTAPVQLGVGAYIMGILYNSSAAPTPPTIATTPGATSAAVAADLPNAGKLIGTLNATAAQALNLNISAFTANGTRYYLGFV